MRSTPSVPSSPDNVKRLAIGHVIRKQFRIVHGLVVLRNVSAKRVSYVSRTRTILVYRSISVPMSCKILIR
ncbi:unnamed protein product [Anisakis simplex]|uniref:Transposase n=1 Tax=Anisakis simplex TaxID=6269 RepID=A0A0M3JF74_ANISI|nr:unnamed protein product [Anisakis simplex]